MALLAAEHLTFRYAGATEPALADASLAVGPGEWVLVCGPSGCGKTTLLRQLKPALAPAGKRTGEVLFEGRPLHGEPPSVQAASVGFVGQSADDALVCEDVVHELAFGLECVGMPADQMRARVAETATYLGLGTLARRPSSQLSGGQRQLVALGAVLAMEPQVLVLDEPCAHLDPLASRMLMEELARLNRDQGMAIVMADHQLGRSFALADRVVVMGSGRVAFDGPPEQAARFLLASKDPMAPALPASARIAAALDASAAPLPLDVAAGQRWLRRWCEAHPLASREGKGASAPEEPAAAPTKAADAAASAIEALGDTTAQDTASTASGRPESAEPLACSVRGLWLRYERDGEDVLRGLDLAVPQGGIHGLLGANGAGKSTLLCALAGVVRPYRGRIECAGTRVGARRLPSVALLPQEPTDLFARDTLGACLDEAAALHGPDAQQMAPALVEGLGIGALLDAHPRDLSAGERQRGALALVLLAQPQLLLLDEPTRNLDPVAKAALAQLLQSMADQGMTVVLATHDLEFCAEHAATVALLFDGKVACQGPARSVLASSALYAPDAALASRPVVQGAVTVDEVVARCRA